MQLGYSIHHAVGLLYPSCSWATLTVMQLGYSVHHAVGVVTDYVCSALLTVCVSEVVDKMISFKLFSNVMSI